MAENKEGQDKSEPASAKRLLEARLRGQVSKSQDVTTAAVLLVGGTALFMLGKPMINQIQDFMKFIFQHSATIEINTDNIIKYYPDLLSLVAKAVLPLMLTIFVIVLLSEISQVGLKIAWKKFGEGSNLKRVFNPFSGIKKMMFSSRSMFELLKSIMKLSIIGLVVYWVLSNHSDDTIDLIEHPVGDIALLITKIAFELVIKVVQIYNYCCCRFSISKTKIS